MRRLTKTFVENQWYRRVSAGQFSLIPRAETQEGPPLDDQIKSWVDETGNIIIHPGQLGMHTAWHGDEDDAYQVKCVSLGLTVLYQEASHGRRQQHTGQGQGLPIQLADPAGPEPGANAIHAGPDSADTGGGDLSTVDGGRPEQGGRQAEAFTGADSEDAAPAPEEADATVADERPASGSEPGSC